MINCKWEAKCGELRGVRSEMAQGIGVWNNRLKRMYLNLALENAAQKEVTTEKPVTMVIKLRT